jgi:plastocyanin
MKTTFTFKNCFTPHLFFLTALILLISTPVFGQVKHVISVTKNKFTPQVLTIAVGDTVEWRNTDGFHNVNGTQTTYPMNPESFGNNTGTGWTYKHVFITSGKYDYQCDPHVGLGMVGTVTVVDSSTTIHEIMVSNGKFTPKDITIKVGDVVKWINTEGSHNVNGSQYNYPDNPESFENGPAASGDWSYTYQFTMPGTYD